MMEVSLNTIKIFKIIILIILLLCKNLLSYNEELFL